LPVDSNTDNGREVFELARRALELGQAERCIDILRSTFLEDCQIASVRYTLAAAYLVKNDLDRAEHHVRACLTFWSGNAAAWQLLGSVLVSGKDWKAAVSCYQKAVLLIPNNASTFGAFASAWSRLSSKALERLAIRAFILAPRNATVRAFLLRQIRPARLPGKVADKLLSHVGLSAIRRLHGNSADREARRTIIEEIGKSGAPGLAEDVMKYILIDDPADPIAWFQLAMIEYEWGLDSEAVEPMLRGTVASGFDRGHLGLFAFIRRAGDDPKRYLSYFSDNRHRSHLLAVQFLALVKRYLNGVDATALSTPDDLRVEAGRFEEVDVVRFLSPRRRSELGSEAVVGLRDVDIVWDLFNQLVIHGENFIVPDREFADAPSNFRHVVYQREARRSLDTAFLVGGGPNYYHWIVEQSRNLKCYVDGGFDMPLLMSGPDLSPPQREMLNLLGIEARAYPWISRPCHIDCRHLFVTKDIFPGYGHDREHLDWIRDLFLGRKSLSQDLESPTRIFITRRNARARVIGEWEVEHALSSIGFTPVTASGMTVSEQARLFSKAEVIVAGHGAGLTNMIFAPTGARVVELGGDLSSLPFLQDLAVCLGHEHILFEGRRVAFDRNITSRRARRYQIDIEKLLPFVNKL
jgi:hypothetical protein